MTVRKHAITKLPYVNSERGLSKDREHEYWIYSGSCIAVRAGGRSLSQAEQWSCEVTGVDGSKWKNGGTWTPTGGVLLQPLLSFRRSMRRVLMQQSNIQKDACDGEHADESATIFKRL